MKPLLLAAFIFLPLSACNSSSNSLSQDTAFVQEQVYEGYPCGHTCNQFKLGYDHALTTGIKDSSLCQGESLEEITGCKAFVVEYQYDTQSYQELVTGFNSTPN